MHSYYYISFYTDGSDFCLSTGTYQYLFTMQLPKELPTSFECDGGYTRYYLRAYIACSSQDELSSLLPVTVLAVFDLNESNYAMVSALLVFFYIVHFLETRHP